jgi:hypothetical protein
MLKDRQGQAVEPTKSARSGSGCRPLVGSGAGLVGRSACGWWSGMPGPSGQIPPPWMRWESEAFTARAAWRPVQASPPGRVRPSGLWPADRQLRCGATCKPPAGPSLSALPGGRARLYGGAPRGASTASAVSVTCKPALSAGHFQPSNRGLSAVRTGVSPGRAGPSGAKGCVLTTGLCWMAPSAASPMCEGRWRRSARPAATWRPG